MSATATALDCGHAVSEHSDVTTGYGTAPDGRRLCYDCITAAETEELKTADTFVAYVKLENPSSIRMERGRGIITNWPGRKLMDIVTARNVSGGGFHYGPVLYVRA